MLGSIRLGSLFGIDVRMHWTFLVLLAVVPGLSPMQPGIVLLGLAAVFGCVLLHELGHSLVARHFGIRVLDITFWPLGGMARMSDIPESPRIEGLVAFAGPAVNFVLAGLAFAGGVLAAATGAPLALQQAIGILFVINVLMGAFNLLPAFPMDGGRILRAFLARRRDYVEATERAVRAGRAVALLMVLGFLAGAFFPGASCALPLVALFVWFAGGRELAAVRLRHGLPPFGRGSPSARPRPHVEWNWTPPNPRPAPTVSQHAVDARRPEAWDWDATSFGNGSPMTEDRIRELERYRGRLRRSS